MSRGKGSQTSQAKRYSNKKPPYLFGAAAAGKDGLLEFLVDLWSAFAQRFE
jgi:hypothetical protein